MENWPPRVISEKSWHFHLKECCRLFHSRSSDFPTRLPHSFLNHWTDTTLYSELSCPYSFFSGGHRFPGRALRWSCWCCCLNVEETLRALLQSRPPCSFRGHYQMCTQHSEPQAWPRGWQPLPWSWTASESWTGQSEKTTQVEILEIYLVRMIYIFNICRAVVFMLCHS